jgi:hypothetical protein
MISATAITISGFQEGSQTGELQPLIAVLRLFFSPDPEVGVHCFDPNQLN